MSSQVTPPRYFVLSRPLGKRFALICLMSLPLVGISLLGPSLLGYSSLASADEDDEEANYPFPEAKYRGGFVATLNLGMTFGGITGYPNEIAKIGDPAYQVGTGAAVGYDFGLWLGHAPRDWFLWQLGFHSGATFGQADVIGGDFAIGAHLEFFPLLAINGEAPDWSIFGEFAAGGGGLANSAGDVLATGGSLANISFGTAWELFKFGSFRMGPAVAYTLQMNINSQYYSNLGWVGIRTSFFGLP